MQIMSAIRVGTYTSASKNTKDRQHGKEPDNIEKNFKILREVPEQAWLFNFWDAFY